MNDVVDEEDKMTQAKAKFDKTILRCKEQIRIYNKLKELKEDSEDLDIAVSQDILRGAIVLAVAAFDAYATDCFSEKFVTYIKCKNVDESLINLLDKAGFNIKFSLELIKSERPYRKIRTLIERYYSSYTTQRLCVINELFLQYHISKITDNAARKSGKKTLLSSVEKIISRRHCIVHDGDYNDFNRINQVRESDIKRIDDLDILVKNMDEIIENKIK